MPRHARDPDSGLAYLNAYGARVEYRPDFLPPSLAEHWLRRLLGELDFDSPERSRMRQPYTGRWVEIPRRQAAYGDPGTSYRFSGNTVAARPWRRALRELRKLVDDATGFASNFVLVNHYRDGSQYMGWHADDERDLGPEPAIASLSLGSRRAFQFRRRGDDASRFETITLDLEPGSLLVMRHPTNAHWKHQLPRRGGSRPERIGERLNLTWRRVELSGT